MTKLSYGSRQLQILSALKETPTLFLIDLLPRPYQRSEYVALHRAAQSLARNGKVEIQCTHMGGMGGGSNTRFITRPGYEPSQRPRPATYLRNDVDMGFEETRINTNDFEEREERTRLLCGRYAQRERLNRAVWKLLWCLLKAKDLDPEWVSNLAAKLMGWNVPEPVVEDGGTITRRFG
jgi:hypothetical protein